MTRLHQLANLGQAVWLDRLRRSLITSGELAALVESGLGGVTSNPAVLEKVVTGSADYDDDVSRLAAEGASPEDICEFLVLDDVGRAADLLSLLHEKTRGADGYVSLDVSPSLAGDAEGMAAEAKRLLSRLGRPNVMVRIPATGAGLVVARELLGQGHSVNVTHVFSPMQYEAAAEACLAGLERLAAAGGDLSRAVSVVSFSLGRVDAAIDLLLDADVEPRFKGTVAVDNARLTYERFDRIFSNQRWEVLRDRDARLQRLVWTDTGTVDPARPDTLYVDNLIGPSTVSTLAPATLRAFLDHGTARTSVDQDTRGARDRLNLLEIQGIGPEALSDSLQRDALDDLARSWDALLAGIAEKRDRLRSGLHRVVPPPRHQEQLTAALDGMRRQRVMARIWVHDFTLWKPDPDEITNRLGWLDVPENMNATIGRLEVFAASARRDGYTHALLLGMGGSSLAPEVLALTHGTADGFLFLDVLDSTDPGAVLARAERLDPRKTLFIVSTKSGGTLETISFFKYFHDLTTRAVGKAAGNHFVAVTDPGSSLVDLAGKHRFRDVFLNDAAIGGRYSALSFFGLVPAALLGMDLGRLLDQATRVSCNCESSNDPVAGDNDGARLGALMGEMAARGRNALTLVTSPSLEHFGNWVEQLVAESTGKEGRGILPVVGEPLGAPEAYGSDRLFVSIRLRGEDGQEQTLARLEEAGHPVVRLVLDDIYDLGGQFFLWEMATAVAGWRMGINPFDQPDVEAAKQLARKMVASYHDSGSLPLLDPVLESGGISVFGDVTAADPPRALRQFVDRGGPGSYVALQAYLAPSGDVDRALRVLRTRIRDLTRLPVTVGYGPRFLHSTGQLHKGDAGRGLFVQFTAPDPRDAWVPGQAGSAAHALSFGILKEAQALGDRQALLDAGRQVLRFRLGVDPAADITRLEKAMG